MADEKVEGVGVEKTGDKQWQKDYKASDVEAVFHRVKPGSWSDIVRWLEEHGENSHERTPGETVAMKEDFQRLEESKAPFTSDPDQAYDQAHKSR